MGKYLKRIYFFDLENSTIRVREMSQVLSDLCVALLLKFFEFGHGGPARLEGAALPLPWGFAAPRCAWPYAAVKAVLQRLP